MPEQSGTSAAAPVRRGRLKRWGIRLAVAAAILAVLLAGGVGVAEHHTSQPNFCASCHIMEPYYASWETDLHGGKLEVACVECHYAPGQRTTVKAKLRGLSQVASYFSGRYGTTRPRAHVSNASCLTSKCHGDMKFMDVPLRIATIEFTHANHLRRKNDQEQSNQARLTELEKALRELAGPERFSELEALARKTGPAKDHHAELRSLANRWDVQPKSDELIEYSQLTHRKVRLAQLADLQCVDCHTYQSQQAETADGQSTTHHFSVQMTTCFTCHFKNESFNSGTASCLLCHDPPTKKIAVHKQLGTDAGRQLNAPELQKQPVTMDHEEMLKRNVGCIACHADVASEDSVVSRRDCERCHDQARFFTDWNPPLNLATVTDYHKLHIPQQRAKCLDCHSEIRHRLVPTDDVHAGESFLTAALANCSHCHPNHHANQVKLLLGKGGLGVPSSEANPMFGSRTNCYGCHAKPETSNGQLVLKGTETTCIACHGEGYASMFEQWKAGVDITLEDAQNAYDNARKAVNENATASAEARKKAEELLAVAEADLTLVKSGNGIHNVTYAIELLDSVTTHSQQAVQALAQP